MTDNEATTVDPLDQVLTGDESKDELQAQAEALGVAKSGTKDQIAERVTKAVEKVVEAAKGVTTSDYTVGAWKGIPNYECNYCPFASLSKRSTIIHVAQAHTRS